MVANWSVEIFTHFLIKYHWSFLLLWKYCRSVVLFMFPNEMVAILDSCKRLSLSICIKLTPEMFNLLLKSCFPVSYKGFVGWLLLSKKRLCGSPGCLFYLYIKYITARKVSPFMIPVSMTSHHKIQHLHVHTLCLQSFTICLALDLLQLIASYIWAVPNFLLSFLKKERFIKSG